jgi:hypothetical protein
MDLIDSRGWKVPIRADAGSVDPLGRPNERRIASVQTVVPFTGSLLYDTAVAILFFFFALWIIVRHGNLFGWFLMILTLLWGYKIYIHM